MDVPLDFEGAAEAGSMLGTTAVMVFNNTVSVPWAVMKWTEFYKHESCGKCTPCREGDLLADPDPAADGPARGHPVGCGDHAGRL
jgi:NADH:ubiquinone oxidoreductase subunit F (NADH-binding)